MRHKAQRKKSIQKSNITTLRGLFCSGGSLQSSVSRGEHRSKRKRVPTRKKSHISMHSLLWILSSIFTPQKNLEIASFLNRRGVFVKPGSTKVWISPNQSNFTLDSAVFKPGILKYLMKPFKVLFRCLIVTIQTNLFRL